MGHDLPLSASSDITVMISAAAGPALCTSILQALSGWSVQLSPGRHIHSVLWRLRAYSRSQTQYGSVIWLNMRSRFWLTPSGGYENS
jgi:hypothetical protein